MTQCTFPWYFHLVVRVLELWWTIFTKSVKIFWLQIIIKVLKADSFFLSIKVQ